MKIFTAKELGHIFDRTVDNEDITTLDLIEREASAVSCEIISRWRPNKRFIVFAGPGNNGSTALAAARMLIEQGYRLEIFLFNIPSMPISEVCKANRDKLTAIEGVDYTEVVNRYDPPYISQDDVVIDGLFGSALSAPLKGGFTALVQQINSSHAFVVSIDSPSGLLGEWNSGNDRRNIIKASLTLTFQFKRLSFFFAENAEYIGTCKVLDIDLDQEEIKKAPSNFYLVEARDVKRRLRKRLPFENKFDYGTLLLVAGSYGMLGAAVLSARAALRSGVGLVTVHSPRCAFHVIQSAVPEAIYEYDKSEVVVSDIKLNHNYSAVAIGPGISTQDVTVNAVDSFLKMVKNPCVIDADALNCIAMRPTLLDSVPHLSILTPHAGEFDRLFGSHQGDEMRLRKAVEMAKHYGIIIVLKGHYTMVVRPDEKVYINSTGNAGLATPGSGDVLTGLIAGFLAQGYGPELSAALGAFIHGYAGDKAEVTQGIYSITASDIIENIGPAMREITMKL